MRRIQVALPLPLAQAFDYLTESPLPIGARVAVTFHRKQMVGFVVADVTDQPAPEFPVKPINRVIESDNPFGPNVWALIRWMSEYYLHPLGAVIGTAGPAALRKIKPPTVSWPPMWRLTAAGSAAAADPPERAVRQAQALAALTAGALDQVTLSTLHNVQPAMMRTLRDKGWVAETEPEITAPAASTFRLNAEQAAACEKIRQGLGQFSAFLLHGVTGSGKTEVYLDLVCDVVGKGGQILVIVPEIGLTPQLISRFRERVGEQVAALHSALSDGQRHLIWRRASEGKLRVVIGTRSALFTPLPSLGLIVVDEEHDASLKQGDGLRYSARDGAVKRAQLEAIPVVLGSATPALESLHNAQLGRYQLLRLSRRAGAARPPEPLVCDLRGHHPARGALTQLSERLVGEELEAGNQVLIFLNRRGFSPALLCQLCGWFADCPHCDARLTQHRSPPQLRCHHCGRVERVPEQCPKCGSTRIHDVGFGTERLEKELRRKFPETPLERIDRDTVRGRHALEQALERVRDGNAGLLIGTQMLAKGHDFPRLTLAVIVNMDQALFSADFRAPEKAAQLLLQVAGRAGRADRPGRVILQTHHPEHPLYRQVLKSGYTPYARSLLDERRGAGFPPFCAFAIIRAEAKKARHAEDFLAGVARSLEHARELEVFGPIPAAMERLAERFRWQLMLKAASRRQLGTALRPVITLLREKRPAHGVRWSLDIDPLDTA